MNVRGDFLKTPHSTNTTALICKSRKENPQKPTQLSSRSHPLNSIVALVTDHGVISLIIGEEHGIQYMSCFSQIIEEMLPENHTMER